MTILASYLKLHHDATKTSNPHSAEVIKILVEAGLLATDFNLVGRLKAALEYIRKRIPSFEASITDPGSGAKLAGKVTLTEPSADERKQGYISADSLLEKLNKGFQETNITAWLLLDRLDVAFSDSPELEGNALRALFRVYLDLVSHSNISIKIFLRDDIWRKLTASGFREASHITRSLTISWDQQSLLNLIVRRLVHNASICTYYSIDKKDVLKNAQLQSNFFYRVFPAQIDIG